MATELCSATVQREDNSVAHVIASSLSGDGAAADVATGAHRATAGPRTLATRGRIHPDPEGALGCKIGSDGFRIVRSADVVIVAETYLGNTRRSLRSNGNLSPVPVPDVLAANVAAPAPACCPELVPHRC